MQEGKQAPPKLWDVAHKAKFRYAVCTVWEYGDAWELECSAADEWRGISFFDNVKGWQTNVLVALVDNVSGNVMRLFQGQKVER